MENKNYPTIEEVIAYFKDAEEVECSYSNAIYSLSFKPCFDNKEEVVSDNGLGYWMNHNNCKNVRVYDFKTKQFAKITKYKTEINLSKITPDLIRELNKDENIHDILVKEGVVVEKAKLEVGKWYKDLCSKNMLICFQGYSDFGVDSYGFNKNGEWIDGYSVWRSKQYIEATPTEVTERLKAEAERKGIKEGAVVNNSKLMDISLDNHLLRDGRFDLLNENCLIYRYEVSYFIIMENGIWCDVISEPKTAYIQVPISEIDNLSSKKLGRFVKELASKY